MTAIDIYVDADGTPVNQRSAVYVWDDFHGTPGDLNWTTSGSGTVTSVSSTGMGQDYPGETQLATTTGSSSDAGINLYGFPETKLQSLEWVFSVPATTTSVAFRVGCFDSISTPTAGFGIEYDTSLGDTALSLVKYVSSVRTVGATLAITASHICRMNWSRSGSGAGTLVLNDLTAATNQTTSLTGLASNVWLNGAYITTKTTSQRTIFVDWMQAVLSGMTR